VTIFLAIGQGRPNLWGSKISGSHDRQRVAINTLLPLPSSDKIVPMLGHYGPKAREKVMVDTLAVL